MSAPAPSPPDLRHAASKTAWHLGGFGLALLCAALAAPLEAGRPELFSRLYGAEDFARFLQARQTAALQRESAREASVHRLDLALDIRPDRREVAVQARLQISRRAPGSTRLTILDSPQIGVTVESLWVSLSGGPAVRATLTTSTLEFSLASGSSEVSIGYTIRLNPALPTLWPHVEDDSGSLPGIFSPFPTVDPTDPLTGTVKVTLPEGYVVAGPGTPTGVTGDDARQTHAFELAPPVRAFALAIAYCKGQAAARQVGLTQVQLLTPGNRADELGDWMDELSTIVKTTADILGPPGYPVVQFVSLPHMVELQGKGCGNVVLLGGRKLLEKFRGERIPLISAFVAHEFAHLYWGNRVASDFSQFFFSEALAQYTAHRVFRRAHDRPVPPANAARLNPMGIMKFPDGVVFDDLSKLALAVRGDHDVPLAEGSFDELTKNVVYGKGPLLLLSLAERVGVEAFDRLLAELVASQSFGISLDWPLFHAQLRSRWSGDGPCLDGFLEPWLFQTGIPREACSSELLDLLQRLWARNYPDLAPILDRPSR